MKKEIIELSLADYEIDGLIDRLIELKDTRRQINFPFGQDECITISYDGGDSE